MAYRFHLKAPIGKEARRIMLEQVEKAERQLEAAETGSNGDTATGIHETRKAMKRIRALLKLIRPGLGRGDYEAENARFRDIAALLAASRDDAVLIATLQKLGAERETLAETIANLVRHYSQAETQGKPNGDAGSAPLDMVREKLHATKHHIRRLRLEPDSFDVIEQGLRLGFKRALRAEALASVTQDDEHVHSWRKAVQQHWRHMALLQRAWPDILMARVALARRISQLLGDDHDLSLLILKLRDTPPADLPELHQQEILKVAAISQHQYRAEAHLLNGLLFAGRPKAFAGQLRDLWHASAALPEASRPKRLAPEAHGT